MITRSEFKTRITNIKELVPEIIDIRIMGDYCRIYIKDGAKFNISNYVVTSNVAPNEMRRSVTTHLTRAENENWNDLKDTNLGF